MSNLIFNLARFVTDPYININNSMSGIVFVYKIPLILIGAALVPLFGIIIGFVGYFYYENLTDINKEFYNDTWKEIDSL